MKFLVVFAATLAFVAAAAIDKCTTEEYEKYLAWKVRISLIISFKICFLMKFPQI